MRLAGDPQSSPMDILDMPTVSHRISASLFAAIQRASAACSRNAARYSRLRYRV